MSQGFSPVSRMIDPATDRSFQRLLDETRIALTDGQTSFVNKNNNLSDLASVSLARDNLGLGSTASVTFGTVNGRTIATDGAKLDGIEAGADVTDAANVQAAGALMDSELTNLAAVKAIDQALATSNTPSFAAIEVSGTQVLTTQQSAIADASGGMVVDTQARTAINAVLAALRTHGIIAT